MKRKKDPNIYPPGMDYHKVAAIAAYYDALKGVDLISEIESQIDAKPESTTWVEVPNAVLNKVRVIISKSKRSA